ncbi:type II toxin-antitoxin system PemK/MazF family toxin [Lactobacillus sp. ESL0677]|uniref:type II toxin-antitoxin system PemK/MazF family toxin n=1 Tax=Lactobacillus sp. ESL0677 TaxID=2983208 RepID=UPI0023F74D52|nr:type II toxin-antitoxin system PemK/MazF family toxin [Lactobacillus sp. ESL0677]WEV37745.1 type II toxin-antitoxin system PemK/MazF family toxin [Lactobacillus sp. ESL0677]
MQPMELYIANVPFDEQNGGKVRPALVLAVKKKYVIVFKITSQYQNKSSKIKKLYYPIKQWQEAGLKKQSYVDTHKNYEITKEAVFSRRPIGKLSSIDIIGLSKFIRKQAI